MDQKKFEAWLDTVCEWCKTTEPEGAITPKKHDHAHDTGMPVVIRVFPRPCGDCGRQCQRTRRATHRKNQHGAWNSYCQECELYRNAETGVYEPRAPQVLSDSTMKKKAQAALARQALDQAKGKTSERTTHLLQRLAQISRPPVPPTNDHSDD